MTDQNHQDTEEVFPNQTAHRQQPTESRPFQKLRSDNNASLSRRRALGGLLVVIGVAGWTFREQLPGYRDQIVTDEGEVSPSPWEKEQQLRDAGQNQRLTLAPSFEYEPVTEQTDDATAPVSRITAVPNDSENGDRITFTVASGFTEEFAGLLVALWANPNQERENYATSVGGTSVEFEAIPGDNIWLGIALQPAEQTNRDIVHTVRGVNKQTVVDLIETYDSFDSRFRPSDSESSPR